MGVWAGIRGRHADSRYLGHGLKAVILYNRPASADHIDAESSIDVLDQANVVETALAEAGIAAQRIEMRGDLPCETDELQRARPDAVFNLVETVNENPLLFPAAAAMLELLGLKFTGSGSFALAASTSKNLSKLVFRGAGLPTPDWLDYNGEKGFSCPGLPSPWLVKPNFEDASIGIEESSLYDDESRLLRDLPGLWESHSKRTLLVERYIEGREFNLSLLETRYDLEVLPIAEIDFSSYHDGKPRIVGYRAKWVKTAFEYQNTPRMFIDDDEESLLCASLREMAVKACRALGIRGYARVDFRVAPDGTPWVIEVNANPCLSLDGGFIAAAAEAGLDASETIYRILRQAVKY